MSSNDYVIDNRSSGLIAASIVCLVIALIGTLIRCASRAWILRAFALDDWLLIITFLSYAALNGIVLQMVHLGLGKHSPDRGAIASVKLFKYIYVAEIVYNTTTLLVKLAFTLFYLRILRQNLVFGQSEKALSIARGFLWFLLGAIICFGIVLECLFIFQCSPISHTWTLFLGTKGHCLTENTLVAVTYAHSAVNGTLDLLLAFLPVPFLWKMELNWRMKMSVIGVLFIGALASVATFIRFKYIKDLPRGDQPDPAWSFEPLVLWSLVEPGLAVLAGGLVASKPLIHRTSRMFRKMNSQDQPALVISVMEEERRHYEPNTSKG